MANCTPATEEEGFIPGTADNIGKKQGGGRGQEERDGEPSRRMNPTNNILPS